MSYELGPDVVTSSDTDVGVSFWASIFKPETTLQSPAPAPSPGFSKTPPNTSHRPFAGVSVLPPIGQLPQQQAPPPYSSEPV